jgi:hypothetical protein
MASRRDQENWQDDKFVIFVTDVSDCAMVTPQAVPEPRGAEGDSRMVNRPMHVSSRAPPQSFGVLGGWQPGNHYLSTTDGIVYHNVTSE